MRYIFILLLLTTASFLTSVTLDECLDYFMENHPIPQKEDLLSQNSEDIIELFRKEWYPKLSLNGSFMWNANTMELGMQSVEKDKTQLELLLSQPIFTGNEISLNREIELLNNAIRKNSLAESTFRIKKLIYTLYFNTLMAEQKSEITQLSLDHWYETADFVKLRQASGKASSLDSLLVANLILSQKETLVNLSQIREESISLLNNLLKTEISFDTDFQEPPETSLSQSEIRRKELLIFTLREDNFELQQKVNTSVYFPKLTAYAKGTYGNPNYNLYANEWAENMEVGLSFKWNFWNWGQEGKRNRLLERKKQINSLEKDEFLTQVNTELLQTESKIGQIDNSLKIKQMKLEVLQKIVAIYYENYRLGKSDVLTYSEKQMEQQQLEESIELLRLEKLYQKYIYNLIIGVL